MHKDLKMQNILMSQNIPKISDFGLSQQIEGEYMITNHGHGDGTITHLAPEMLFEARKIKENRQIRSSIFKAKILNIDYKVDIWALGVMLFHMLVGFLPFCCNGLLKYTEDDIYEEQLEEINSICIPEFNYDLCCDKQRERAQQTNKKVHLNPNVSQQQIEIFQDIFVVRGAMGFKPRITYNQLCKHPIIKPYIKNYDEYIKFYSKAPQLMHLESKVYNDIYGDEQGAEPKQQIQARMGIEEISNSSGEEQDEEANQQRQIFVRNARVQHYNTRIFVAQSDTRIQISKNIEIYELYRNRYQFLTNLCEQSFEIENQNFSFDSTLENTFHEPQMILECKFFMIRAALYYINNLSQYKNENIFNLSNWAQVKNSKSYRQFLQLLQKDQKLYQEKHQLLYDNLKQYQQSDFQQQEIMNFITEEVPMQDELDQLKYDKKQTQPTFVNNMSSSIKLPLRNDLIWLHNQMFEQAQHLIELSQDKRQCYARKKKQEINSLATEVLRQSLEILMGCYIFKIIRVEDWTIDLENYNDFKQQIIEKDKTMNQFMLLQDWIAQLEREDIYQTIQQLQSKNMKGQILQNLSSYKYLQEQ